jgi:hypothetical protein
MIGLRTTKNETQNFWINVSDHLDKILKTEYPNKTFQIIITKDKQETK